MALLVGKRKKGRMEGGRKEGWERRERKKTGVGKERRIKRGWRMEKWGL